MSGIVGIYSLIKKILSCDDIAKMIKILAHRGPDGSSIWHSENIALGHLMLLTTPESLQEKLPFVDATNNYVITADARIDNREELIPLLKLEGKEISSIADSEIILAAYQKWGKDCPKKLLGDFAFAIWDRSKQHLFCARDHFGVKPFYYYYQTSSSFVFASEIKALFTHSFIKRKINPNRLADFLELDFSNQIMTSYENIFRLPPAHYCIVSLNQLEINQYWSLDPRREIKFDSDQEYADAFRKIFLEAVRCRLRSAFPIGSHLSGGLDSSSVTCVARKLLSEDNLPLHAFSNIFNDVPECDEREHINQVLEQNELIPHYVHADRFKLLSNLKQFWQYEDDAYVFPSYHYLWSLNKASQQAGVRVVLDGFDGDSVVWHGFERLGELALQGKWDDFVWETKQTAKNYQGSASILARQYGLEQLVNLAQSWNCFTLIKGIHTLHKNFGFSRKEIFMKYILKPLFVRLKYLLTKNEHLIHKYEFSLLNSDFIQNYDLQAYFANQKQNDDHEIVIDSLVKKQHFQNLNDSDGVASFAFEQADKCSSPFMMEMRHPFFDKRLVEFCLALPSEQKLRGGFGRIVMRRALEDILPAKIQWRGDKTSMTPNFLNSISKLDRELLDQEILKDKFLLQRYINIDKLLKAYKEVTSNRNSKDIHNLILWRSVVISMWLHHSKLRL